MNKYMFGINQKMKEIDDLGKIDKNLITQWEEVTFDQLVSYLNNITKMYTIDQINYWSHESFNYLLEYVHQYLYEKSVAQNETMFKQLLRDYIPIITLYLVRNFKVLNKDIIDTFFNYNKKYFILLSEENSGISNKKSPVEETITQKDVEVSNTKKETVNNDMSELISLMMSMFKSLENRIDNLSNEVTKNSIKLEELKAQMNELKMENTHEVNDDVKITEEIVEEIVQEVNEVEEESKVYNDILVLEIQNKALQSEIDDLKREIDERINVEKLLRQNTISITEKDALEEDYKETITKLEDKISDLENKEEVVDLSEDLERKENEVRECRDRIEELTTENMELNDKLNKMKSIEDDKNRYFEERNELEKKNHELEQLMETMQQQLKEAMNQIEEQKVLNQNLSNMQNDTKELEELNDTISLLREALSDVKRDKDNALNEINELKKELNELKSRNANIASPREDSDLDTLSDDALNQILPNLKGSHVSAEQYNSIDSYSNDYSGSNNNTNVEDDYAGYTPEEVARIKEIERLVYGR